MNPFVWIAETFTEHMSAYIVAVFVLAVIVFGASILTPAPKS